MKWVKSELNICQNFHHLFTDLVGGDPKYCRQIKPDWTVDEASCHGEASLQSKAAAPCGSCGGSH
jgi:hypothetical protein